MQINELMIVEDDFDLFVALDDADKIEFLFDATEYGIESAVIKHVGRLADKYLPKEQTVSSEDFQVGPYRLCVTTFQDSEIQLNSNSLRAIRQFVRKLWNDGVILYRLDKKKTEFDMYRYFKAYKIVGRVQPFCES